MSQPKFTTKHPVETFLKRVMWLAYQSAIAHGMGMFKATDNATEESVWEKLS